MKKYQAVVFDLDDTLYPEIEYVISGFRAAARWIEQHLQIPQDQAFAEMREIFQHGDRAHVFDEWLNLHRNPNIEIVQKLVCAYREHDPIIHAFPEIPSLLQTLKNHCKLALLSDGFIDVQKKKLAALNLAGYFDLILFSDEWGRDAWKPNAVTFGMLLDKLKVSGSQAIYIADNPLKDFHGARSAGMDTIRLRISGCIYEKESPVDRTYEPDFEFTNHNEVRLFLLGPFA